MGLINAHDVNIRHTDTSTHNTQIHFLHHDLQSISTGSLRPAQLNKTTKTMSMREIVAPSEAPGVDNALRKAGVLHMMMEVGLIAPQKTCPPNDKHALPRPTKSSLATETKDGHRWRCTCCKKERSVQYLANKTRDANVCQADWMRFIIE